MYCVYLSSLLDKLLKLLRPTHETGVIDKLTFRCHVKEVTLPVDLKIWGGFIQGSRGHISSFLALLCATAPQSHCHHAGIRCPSVVRRHRFLGHH